MNTTLRINRKIILIIAFVLLLIGVGVAIYLISQRQDVRQRAAGGADLLPLSIQLTDAGGNVRTKFFENEDIYVKVTITNQGDSTGTSTTGRTISQIYSNSGTPAAFDSTSDVGISMNNGEFGVGGQRTYESRIKGQNQTAFVSDPYSETSARKYAWRKSTAGNYTARVLLNSTKDVTETDYDNNQATIQYEVVPFTNEIGTQSTTKPADFDDWPCVEHDSAFVTGFTGCIQQVRGPDTKVQGRITNNTGATASVAIASYKAYLPYIDPGCSSTECPDQYDFTWTQTFHRAELFNLQPGQTVYLSTNVPACAWQADIFINGFPKSFHPNINTYGSGIGFVDGWYNFYPNYDQQNTTFCKASIVTPSPTPTVAPSITPTLPPGITPTDTPIPTNTPTVSPSACPTPAKVTNVRIICPNCTQ